MTRDRFAVLIIVVHFLAALLHGAAHATIGVSPGGWADVVVIAAAVYVGPLVALVWLLRGRRTTGGLVLSASMAAALIYGVAFHYVLQTPDHIVNAPHSPWGYVFRVTAALIAVLEAGGFVTGAVLVRSPTPRA